MGRVEWRKEWFDHICRYVGAHDDEREFLRILYEAKFTWEDGGVVEDKNRESSGRILRRRWWDKRHDEGLYPYELVNERCSFIEMLLGVASDMEALLMDPQKGDRTRVYFWTLIDNIGLGWVTDDQLNDVVRENVLDVVHGVCERRYQWTGEGGLFPLKNPARDQRKVEIWYQMQAYLHENFVDENGKLM